MKDEEIVEDDLSKMKKSELIEYGSNLGLELDDSMTVKEIIERINEVV